jgi:hypothetical protein
MKKFVTALTLLSLVGCSSSPIKKSEDYNVKLANSNKLIEVEKSKSNSFIYPEWYMSLVVKDNVIFVSGTDFSSDANFAIDKAMMNAKREIAIYISSITSNINRNYAKDNQANDTSRTDKITAQTTRIITPNIDLARVTRDKVVLRKEGEYYRAFVRVYMPLDNAIKNPGVPNIKSANIEREAQREFSRMQ